MGGFFRISHITFCSNCDISKKCTHIKYHTCKNKRCSLICLILVLEILLLPALPAPLGGGEATRPLPPWGGGEGCFARGGEATPKGGKKGE
jgi:hypothetical protein